MNRYQYLAWPAYAVAFTLIVVPFFDATMSVWPLKPGSEQWRFGAVGLFSNAFLIPAAGLLIALVTALVLAHASFLRVLGALCALGALFMSLLVLLFALDAIQTRLNVQPAVRFSFVVASFTAAAKLILGAVTLSAFAVAGLRTRLPKPSAAPAGLTSFPAASPRAAAS